MTKTILAARLAALIPELAKDSLLNREATIFAMLGELEDAKLSGFLKEIPFTIKSWSNCQCDKCNQNRYVAKWIQESIESISKKDL